MTMRQGPAEPRWTVADAKAKFSEVIREAQRVPQVIQARGKEVAVVLGADAFRRVAGQPGIATVSERWRRFLIFSAELRAGGDGDLKLAKRARRPSPFRNDAGR